VKSIPAKTMARPEVRAQPAIWSSKLTSQHMNFHVAQNWAAAWAPLFRCGQRDDPFAPLSSQVLPTW